MGLRKSFLSHVSPKGHLSAEVIKRQLSVNVGKHIDGRDRCCCAVGMVDCVCVLGGVDNVRYDDTNLFMPICQNPTYPPGPKRCQGLHLISSHLIALRLVSSCLAKDAPALSRLRLPRARSRRVIFRGKVSRFPPTPEHVSPLNASAMIGARSSRRW